MGHEFAFTVGNIVQDPFIQAAVFLNRRLVTAVSLMRLELSHRLVSDPKTRDFAQYDRCPGLDGLEVMSARWVEHSFAPHMHDFYAVSLNYRGRGAFDCRHQTSTMPRLARAT